MSPSHGDVSMNNTYLLVDDDPVFSGIISNLLVENGKDVVTAYSKAEGLAMFERERPACVLLDIGLPDGSGVDLIRPMRTISPETPIIMVSGQAEVSEVVLAMKEGASDYVKKPFRNDELLLKIQKAMETSDAMQELQQLRRKVRPEDEYNLLFSLGDRMSKVQAIVDQVANTDITVLITGESGTGKELVAKALHKVSERVDAPFIKVNCAALPRELLESELFGFERGSFTGAHRRKTGRFEVAQNGTIFLDEIGEMDIDIQSKLLHVLQEKQFYRIGGEKEIKVNCRIIVATNRNLATMVEEGRFRRDLYYRVNVVNIILPPLRERREDIPLLVDFFLNRYSDMYNRARTVVPDRLMKGFLEYDWPGNIRELENNIKRFVILGNEVQLLAELSRKHGGGSVKEPAGFDEVRRPVPVVGLAPPPGDLPKPIVEENGRTDRFQVASDGKMTLKEVSRHAQRAAERELIGTVLLKTRWNRRKAASILDISYKALLYKIKECGLSED